MPASFKKNKQRVSHWSSAGSLNSFGESLQHASSGTVPSSQGSRLPFQQPQQDTLQNRFEIIRTLGKGTYGKVKLARDRRTNQQVAIKTIRKSRIENPHDLERMWREINFMSNLSHPHIIKIKEVYESREKIILVMEYASGGELYEYLNRMKRIPESEARAIFRQIISAVHFLHKSHIVHRDLKLENILIDDRGNIKLADFGLSNNWGKNRLLYTFCGSPLYASPEIVNGIPYYGPEVDCWSLGVLLYTLVYGSMPFQGGDYARLVKNISTGSFIQPREKSGAFSLIQRCLCINPAKRASIDESAEHWWVNFGYKNLPILCHANNMNRQTIAPSMQTMAYFSSPNNIATSRANSSNVSNNNNSNRYSRAVNSKSSAVNSRIPVVGKVGTSSACERRKKYY
ncbi:hypothetical protein GJ496_000308 [Pomphorhynchus laevis]|nr:hypothetical protein GJ496_000308 [Pomphorhynchus laevis]